MIYVYRKAGDILCEKNHTDKLGGQAFVQSVQYTLFTVFSIKVSHYGTNQNNRPIVITFTTAGKSTSKPNTPLQTAINYQ